MRCFIAIDIPEEFKSEISKSQNTLRNVSGLSAKFVASENFHLTLRFLDEVSDSQVKRIKENLSSVKFQPFKVHLGKAGIFPSESYVRVIWVSLEPDEKVKELARAINTSLGSRDERFESHITLARVRNAGDKSALKKALRDVKVEKKDFKVKNFKLKKSTLTAKGPIYEDVAVFSLD